VNEREIMPTKLKTPRRATVDSKFQVDLDKWMFNKRTAKIKTAEESEFSWIEKKGSSFFFVARHRFGFTKEDESGNECEDKTTFTHRVHSNGILAWWTFVTSRKKSRAKYERMANEVKKQVEEQYAKPAAKPIRDSAISFPLRSA